MYLRLMFGLPWGELSSNSDLLYLYFSGATIKWEGGGGGGVVSVEDRGAGIRINSLE